MVFAFAFNNANTANIHMELSMRFTNKRHAY